MSTKETTAESANSRTVKRKSRENDKGEYDTASYEVGKERYDAIKIGDEISFE